MSIEKMDATGKTVDGRKHTASLEHAVKFVAGWHTPHANDAEKRGNPSPDNRNGLIYHAQLTASPWATPSSRDWKDSPGMATTATNPDGSERTRLDQLPRQAQQTVIGGGAIWLPCLDGKARPTQPGLFPLAHGIAGRVGRLRAYGNAIVAEQAAEFIRAYLEVIAARKGDLHSET